MKTRYRAEVIQEIITPVIVEADSKQSAIDLLIQQQGEAGDSYSGETKILSVEKLED